MSIVTSFGHETKKQVTFTLRFYWVENIISMQETGLNHKMQAT